jgi:DNA-binding FadR family transcriptional regulator
MNQLRRWITLPLSKVEEITGILREEILRGQYRPGERLPSERDLAARFEANRGAVREAIKKLEQLGIAEVKPGGVRIVAIEDATLEVLGHLMDLDELPSPSLVGQLFEVFGAMLSHSARSAIESATEEQINEIYSIVGELRNSTESQHEYHSNWRALSNCFIEINQNLVLRLIGNGLKTQFMGRLDAIGLHPQIDKVKANEYLDMFENAIQTRDQEAAGNAIIGHFQLLKTGMQKTLEQKHQAQFRSVNHA